MTCNSPALLLLSITLVSIKVLVSELQKWFALSCPEIPLNGFFMFSFVQAAADFSAKKLWFMNKYISEKSRWWLQKQLKQKKAIIKAVNPGQRDIRFLCDCISVCYSPLTAVFSPAERSISNPQSMECLRKLEINVSLHFPLQAGGTKKDGSKEEAHTFPAGAKLLKQMQLVCAVEGKKSQR